VKERDVTDDINEVLRAHKPLVSWYRPVPSVYGQRFVDYVGVSCGYYWIIEAKRPGKDATDAQYIRAKEIEAAGGAAFVINSPTDVIRFERWLTKNEAKYIVRSDWPTIPFRHIKVIR
jgi:hypothetical protein